MVRCCPVYNISYIAVRMHSSSEWLCFCHVWYTFGLLKTLALFLWWYHNSYNFNCFCFEFRIQLVLKGAMALYGVYLSCVFYHMVFFKIHEQYFCICVMVYSYLVKDSPPAYNERWYVILMCQTIIKCLNFGNHWTVFYMWTDSNSLAVTMYNLILVAAAWASVVYGLGENLEPLTRLKIDFVVKVCIQGCWFAQLHLIWSRMFHFWSVGGLPCVSCHTVFAQILCHLRTQWSPRCIRFTWKLFSSLVPQFEYQMCEITLWITHVLI